MAVERVAGVVSADFSFEEGSGVVTYDVEETGPETFIEELADKTGFLATVVSSGQATSEAEEEHR